MAFGLTDTSRLGCQVRLTKELDGMSATLPAATRNMFVDGALLRPFRVLRVIHMYMSREKANAPLAYTALHTAFRRACTYIIPYSTHPIITLYSLPPLLLSPQMHLLHLPSLPAFSLRCPTRFPCSCGKRAAKPTKGSSLQPGCTLVYYRSFLSPDHRKQLIGSSNTQYWHL